MGLSPLPIPVGQAVAGSIIIPSLQRSSFRAHTLSLRMRLRFELILADYWSYCYSRAKIGGHG